jgi:DNA-binding beta-propeller fold protein YncE
MTAPRALASILVLTAACEGPLSLDASTGSDASAVPDAGLDAAGVLTLSLSAPRLGYLDEDTCIDLVVSRASAALEIVWGDGQREDASVGADGTARSCHAYAWPGTILVGAIARDDGERAEATRTLLVVPRPSDPRPTSSSTIAYDPGRSRVWVVNPDHGTIAVLSHDDVRIALEREIPVCEAPRTVSVLGAHALVACQGDARVVRIDAASLAITGEIALPSGSRPYGVAHDPRGAHAFVALQDLGAVVVIDVETPAAVATLEVGPDLRNLAVNAEGDLLVTAWRGSSDGAAVHLLDVRDATRPSRVGTTRLEVQRGLDSDTDNDGVPSFLSQVVFSPDGAHALIPALKANVIAGLSRTGLPLTSQTTSRGILVELALGAVGEPAFEVARFPFDDLDAGSAVVYSPEGARTYTTLRGAGAVVANDPFSYDMVGSISDAGIAPEGLVLSPEGRFLFVQDFLGRSVRVFDVSVMPIPTLVTEVRTAMGEPLSDDVLAGKIVFYRSRDPRMSRTGYVSCASCHLDGESDGLTWDFTQRGEGLRNTIDLLGRAGTGHGPMHWSANFDEVQDFEGDIRNGQGGSGFLSAAQWSTHMMPLGDPKSGLSAELDQLSAYLTSLSTFDVSPHRHDGDAEWEASRDRGEALFRRADVGCSGCHSGERLTDSAFTSPGTPRLHDVGTIRPTSGMRLGGTLTGLDTPTLHGLWRSAPYLHDGSADSLRDVLVTRNPEDRHGVTSALSPSDLDDLETFLLAL